MVRFRGAVALFLLVAFTLMAAHALNAGAIFTNSRSVPSNGFTLDTLDAPTSPSATGGSSIQLNWTASADTYATGHRVLRGTSAGGPFSQIAEVTPRTTTTYTDSPSGGTYYYVIRAYYQNWESADTSVVSAQATPSTGFSNCTANYAVTSSSGDNNGFQTSPSNACADDASYATDTDSGTSTTATCSSTSKDRHVYYDYDLNVPSDATVTGFAVRLDAWADSTFGSPFMCVELSWNGGANWTSAKSSSTLGTSQAPFILGNSSDDWGRTWSPSEVSNSNFRVRITNVAASTSRDFFLDWVAVNVAYTLPPAGDVQLANSWTTGLTHTAGIGTDRLLVLAVGHEDCVDPTISSITWGGQSLTRVNQAVSTSGGCSNRVEVWYLNEAAILAASGNTFTVNWIGGTPGAPAYAAATYKYVNQSNPVATSATTVNTSSTPNPITRTVSTVADAMVISAAVSGNNGSYTWNNSFTEQNDQTSAATMTLSTADKVATGSSGTASATHVGPNRQAMIAFVLNADRPQLANSWTTGLTHATGAGTNRLLMFAVTYENCTNNPGVSTVTYGGRTLTRITGTSTVSSGCYAFADLWYLNEADIAAASNSTFTVTWGGTAPADPMYAAVTYKNVNQASPVASSNSASTSTSTPNPITTTVTAPDGGAVASVAICGNAAAYTWNNGFTERVDQTSGSTTNMSTADKFVATGGTETASATNSSPNRQVIVAAALNRAN